MICDPGVTVFPGVVVAKELDDIGGAEVIMEEASKEGIAALAAKRSLLVSG